MNKLKGVCIRNLQIAFQTKTQLLSAVNQIDCDLQPGKTLALLGESGCGKSVTALGIMRLLPLTAVYGQKSQILLDHEDLLNLPEALMRQLRGRRLGMIFQEPMTALNPVLRVDKQLKEVVLKNEKLSGSRLKQRLIELLREVEITEPELKLYQYPHQLSGGQKQRVVIAMAIANKPEILIADEPTTALDVTIQAQILQLLKKLQQQHNMSLLLITHDLGVVKAMADEVLVMYAGQLVEKATAEEFFNEVKHPYSLQLLASLPSYEKRQFRLHAIAGAVPSLDNLPPGCSFNPRCQFAFSRCTSEKPELLPSQGRQVRCHLYSQLETLPPLQIKEEGWQNKFESDKVILSVKNLKVNFTGPRSIFKLRVPKIHAVDDLSFELKKGATLALVGESGCGKTTVAKALLKLQPISSGDILFLDQNLNKMGKKTLRAYRKRVQIIFQDPFSSLNPRLTIAEIIAEGMIAQKWSNKKIKDKQLKLLEQVNLPRNALTRYPHQFSGGQRQRICIARALATEPEILICDEPTSALDVSVQAQILNLLKELQYELGMSYLFITHNMAVVSYIADEVLVMREGREVEAGSVESILKSPQTAYTQKLLSSILTV